MLYTSKKMKEIYDEIQRKIFNAVPGKWDELYLYASIIDRLGSVQTGEMYFYFMPKGILRKKFINVYEIPSKYNIEEEEYMRLVDLLYKEIKLLRDEFFNENQKVWSNITISIKNNRFKIEYNYDTLIGGQAEYYDHHIFWRSKYLNIAPRGKKEKNAIEQYLINRRPSKEKDEEYDIGIYNKKQNNIITFETTEFKESQKVEYIATEMENEKKTKNQIIFNK